MKGQGQGLVPSVPVEASVAQSRIRSAVPVGLLRVAVVEAAIREVVGALARVAVVEAAIREVVGALVLVSPCAPRLT